MTTMEPNSLSDRKEMFRSMLADAVAVLCRNTMPYDAELSIEGLIGITADKKDIVLVSINEIIGQGGQQKSSPTENSAASLHKSKSRKRKKMRLSNPEPEKENKITKVSEDVSLVSELSKELADFDVTSFVKKELPEVNQVTPYGGYRNELYNTNDHQLSKPAAPAPDFPADTPLAAALQQFTDANVSVTGDFSSFNPGSDAAAALGQPHSELLVERLDENGGIVYQCTMCQKIIKSKGNFGRHIKGHVNSAVIHTCELCGKTFGRKDNLRRHLTMVHQVETPTKGSSANPGGEDGDSVGDFLPGLGDSLPADNPEHASNNGDKAVFPQGEENHAAKYFQQHTISSLGLDNSGLDNSESEEQHVANNSTENTAAGNLQQDTAASKLPPTQEYFQQATEPTS